MQTNSGQGNNVENVLRTYDTLKPLRRLLKIFSLNCNEEKETFGGRNTFFLICRSVPMAIILGSLNIISLYWKICKYYDNIDTSIKITDGVQMIYDLFLYFFDISFVLVYGRGMSFEYFKQYGKIDNIIRMTYYSEIKTRLFKLVAFISFIWIASSVCDFTAWYFIFGWEGPIVYSIAYFYSLIKFLTVLDLVSHVMQVECRLRCLGDLLLAHHRRENKDFVEDCALKYNWFYPNNKVDKAPNSHIIITSNLMDEVKWLRRYYLLLIEQTVFINKMYGMRMLLNSLNLLIDMVRFTNIAVRYLIMSRATVIIDYFPAISCLSRLSFCAAIIISLVHHCEKTYRERDRIIFILDHYLVMTDPSNEDRTAMNLLRDLVQSRVITFHMAYFFRFDYSLLVSMASLVVTYTIIIIQNVN